MLALSEFCTFGKCSVLVNRCALGGALKAAFDVPLFRWSLEREHAEVRGEMMNSPGFYPRV